MQVTQGLNDLLTCLTTVANNALGDDTFQHLHVLPDNFYIMRTEVLCLLSKQITE